MLLWHTQGIEGTGKNALAPASLAEISLAQPGIQPGAQSLRLVSFVLKLLAPTVLAAPPKLPTPAASPEG
jgi:hypothetical protein